jgi:predicted enzyme related to lactoylglutathione lyase
MGERTSHAPGTFSWVDLGTSDADGAKAFYGGLLGWEFQDMPVPDSPPYSMASIGGRAVAALYAKRDEQAPSAWLSYVTVEDPDAIAARTAELGGTVISEPFDVLEAGRMAVLQDPTGGVFAVWQPRASIGAQLVNDAGALCLNQLNTSDPGAAQAFFGALFGWTFQGIESGGQSYWGIDNDGRLNGGMMPLPEGAGAPSHWLAYFTSADVDASVAKIGELGGAVLVPPSPIPSGRIAVAADPQGAVFALFEGRVDP